MLYQPEPDTLLTSAGPMRILIVSDAWTPQVNGVVRTLRTVVQELQDMGKVVEVVGPDRFFTIPMPSYPEIQLAIFPGKRLEKIIDEFQPDALHIATEGPLGMAARAYAIRRKVAFTTAFHTRFAEYLKARTGIPEFISYAWLRRFHGAGAAVMVATQSLRDELVARGFENVRPWSRGVDLAAFSPEPKENFDLPRPIFLYVGRVAVEKNLRAFLKLDLPGSKLVVGDGPQRRELEAEFPYAHFVGARHGAELAKAYAGVGCVRVPLQDRHVRPGGAGGAGLRPAGGGLSGHRPQGYSGRGRSARRRAGRGSAHRLPEGAGDRPRGLPPLRRDLFLALLRRAVSG